MLQEAINGFCMALADSVPGVSGGTVAFIMGFYDKFIGSIHQLAFETRARKIEGACYLARLGVGWVIGMGMAVLVLAALFASHIYTVSSLFIGFIAGSLPLIIWEEKASLLQLKKGLLWGVLGVLLVVGITWLNGRLGTAALDMSIFSVGLGLRLFCIGMAAIAAMFLPGISGSTLLLIFGVYLPIITAVKGLLTLNFAYLPALLCFVGGIAVGALTVVKGIRTALETYRPQAIYAIMGMMLGSFYAIIMGPTTLAVPQHPLYFNDFSLLACALGVLLVLGMYMLKAMYSLAEN